MLVEAAVVTTQVVTLLSVVVPELAKDEDASIANRGSGGGGRSGDHSHPGGDGSSGVVILRVPSTITATFTSGVTSSSATVGSNKVYTITATSDNSQTVTFS